MRSVLSAWFVGFAVVVAIHILWLMSFLGYFTPNLDGMFYAVSLSSPALGALCTAYLAPTHKAIAGLAIAIPSAIFCAALMGFVSFYGWSVDRLLAYIFLFVSFIFYAAGVVFISYIAKDKK
jgi:hypothetical protein